MFRITQTRDQEATILCLEGSLTAAELPLLEEALAEVNGTALKLDLSGVRWIDGLAARRLQALRDAGAAVTAASPFVAKLLGDAR